MYMKKQNASLLHILKLFNMKSLDYVDVVRLMIVKNGKSLQIRKKFALNI